MSKFDEAFLSYREQIGYANECNEELLTKIAKYLGPSIYQADASLVSCTDATEKAYIRKNFLVGRCGLADGPELDGLIEEVCNMTVFFEQRRKYRAVFYYYLVVNNGLESLFMED